jgi:hypothetical protein
MIRRRDIVVRFKSRRPHVGGIVPDFAMTAVNTERIPASSGSAGS